MWNKPLNTAAISAFTKHCQWEARRFGSTALSCRAQAWSPNSSCTSWQQALRAAKTHHAHFIPGLKNGETLGHLYPHSWDSCCPRPHTSPCLVLPSAAPSQPHSSCIPQVWGLTIPTLLGNCTHPMLTQVLLSPPSASYITPDCGIPSCSHTHTLSRFLPPFFCLWSWTILMFLC